MTFLFEYDILKRSEYWNWNIDLWRKKSLARRVNSITKRKFVKKKSWKSTLETVQDWIKMVSEIQLRYIS